MKNHSPVELETRLYLHGLPELGPMRFLRLIEAFGSASSALAVPAGAWHTLEVPAEAAAMRRSPAVRETMGETLRWLEDPRRHLLMWGDLGYPALFAEVADAPPLLYVEGTPGTLERPQLTMVSDRRAGPAGLGTARSFACSLAQGGFAIVSGLALGISGAAHEDALEVGGATVAVLGTSLRRLCPRRHEALTRRIVGGGDTLVSELPLNNPPLSANFPRHNRIINEFSLGVLVVEASPTSSSLITARLAAEQGREIYAISGFIHHPDARGCHQLIRDGAPLVESVGRVLEALRGWAQAKPAEAPAQPLPHPLLALLRTAPYTSESPAATSGTTLPDVLAMLSELEFDDWVAYEASTWVHRSG